METDKEALRRMYAKLRGENPPEEAAQEPAPEPDAGRELAETAVRLAPMAVSLGGSALGHPMAGHILGMLLPYLAGKFGGM